MHTVNLDEEIYYSHNFAIWTVHYSIIWIFVGFSELKIHQKFTNEEIYQIENMACHKISNKILVDFYW